MAADDMVPELPSKYLLSHYGMASQPQGCLWNTDFSDMMWSKLRSRPHDPEWRMKKQDTHMERMELPSCYGSPLRQGPNRPSDIKAVSLERYDDRQRQS